MLDLNKVIKEIKKLEECGNSSYDTCEKLAYLYIVKDHYKPAGTGQSSEASIPASPTMSSPMLGSVK